MGNILNGITLSGLTRCYGGTFLVFSGLHAPSASPGGAVQDPDHLRLDPDSVGVGEDGPTHQPVEHVMSLRLMPDLDVAAPRTPTRPHTPGPRSCGTTGKPAALVRPGRT